MTQNEWAGVVIGIVAIGLLLLICLPVKDHGDEQPQPSAPPPRPSLPPFCAVPEQREPQESYPLVYPVPGQQADTEWLPMSPDVRAGIVDDLQALWDASPDEADVRTDLRADPGPHDAA